MFSNWSGLEISAEKTFFTVIASKKAHENGIVSKFPLTFKNTPIQHTAQIKILGVTFQTNGRADTWMQQIKTHWHRVLGIIKRITTKSWGAQDDTLRTLYRCLLESKAMYGYNYLHLTKGQENQLEILNRKAMRVITGLPKFTEITNLEKLAQINRLKDTAEERKASQLVRLQGTLSGRTLLQTLAPLTPDLPPLTTPLPPWDFFDTTGEKPLPPHTRTTPEKKGPLRKHTQPNSKLTQTAPKSSIQMPPGIRRIKLSVGPALL